MPYHQRYAWVMRFDLNNTIVQVGNFTSWSIEYDAGNSRLQVRAYLDSALVQKAVDFNAC